MKQFILIIIGLAMVYSCKKDRSQSEEEHLSYPFKKEGMLSLWDAQGNAIKTIEIEIADNDTETRRGLMDRDSMREDRGMLFISDENRVQGFYMKNTRFPLDLVYISPDSLVVDIQQGEPFNQSTIPSDTVSQYVLELNKGMAQKWGIKEGETKVSWQKETP